MTVEELRKKLENCAPNATVWLYNKRADEWITVKVVSATDGELVALEG